MEKWALKIGLAMEEAESDKALHWLTSAIGEDPALIGLTRVEGGGPPAIGAAQQLGLGQVCPKSMADERSQNPGRIGLKNWNSTTLLRLVILSNDSITTLDSTSPFRTNNIVLTMKE